jgi:hypothetical protein
MRLKTNLEDKYLHFFLCSISFNQMQVECHHDIIGISPIPILFPLSFLWIKEADFIHAPKYLILFQQNSLGTAGSCMLHLMFYFLNTFLYSRTMHGSNQSYWAIICYHSYSSTTLCMHYQIARFKLLNYILLYVLIFNSKLYIILGISIFVPSGR